MIQAFFVAIFVVMFSVALGTIAYKLWEFSVPPKRYGIFLCHHKGGGAVLARYFKEVISDVSRERVFLDSDDLDSLEGLFRTVEEDTKNLVVLLTSETLWRMWCAGEICSAFCFHVNMVPVRCADDFK